MKIITEKPGYIIHEALGINQSNWDAPENLAIGQLSMEKLFRTIAIEAPAEPLALPRSAQMLPFEQLTFTDPLKAEQQLNADTFLNRRLFNDALLIMHKGKVVHESYRNGMRHTDRHVLHSCTKSLCAMLIAIALEEGRLCLDAEISRYIPEFAQRDQWRGVTLQHVLDMQAGIEYSEDYSNPDANYWHYARAAGYYPPLPGEQAIGAKAWIYDNLNTRIHTPGTTFVYNSCLANVLGMALENVYEEHLGLLFEELLYQRVGPESDGYFNTDPQGFPITEGQLNLRLRDFARCAHLMINDGKNLAGEQVLPATFVHGVCQASDKLAQAYQRANPDPLFPRGQYHNQFWVSRPQLGQFTMLGIHGQFAWYDLNRALMIVGFGSFPVQDGLHKMRCLDTLWTTLGIAVDEFTGGAMLLL